MYIEEPFSLSLWLQLKQRNFWCFTFVKVGFIAQTPLLSVSSFLSRSHFFLSIFSSLLISPSSSSYFHSLCELTQLAIAPHFRLWPARIPSLSGIYILIWIISPEFIPFFIDFIHQPEYSSMPYTFPPPDFVFV